MPFYKKISDNELYLYFNGNLIYKRWLKTGEFKVFDVMAYDKYTLKSFRDTDAGKETSSFIIVKAKLKMKSTDEGGRATGFFSGYRPNHVFEYTPDQTIQAFMGDIQFNDQSTIEPGEEKVVTVRFLGSQPIEEFLTIGRTWWICEGANQLGQATILEVSIS